MMYESGSSEDVSEDSSQEEVSEEVSNDRDSFRDTDALRIRPIPVLPVREHILETLH